MAGKCFTNMIASTFFFSRNATIHSSGYYGRSNGPLMISRLDCSGAEEDIFFCRSSKWKSGYCPYYQDNVAIDCSKYFNTINTYTPIMIFTQSLHQTQLYIRMTKFLYFE